MRHAYIITGIILGHLVFVFVTIYQQTWVTQLMYEQQALEAQKTKLMAQQATSEQELYNLRNTRAITHYATHTRALQPISLRHVYQLDAIMDFTI